MKDRIYVQQRLRERGDATAEKGLSKEKESGRGTRLEQQWGTYLFLEHAKGLELIQLHRNRKQFEKRNARLRIDVSFEGDEWLGHDHFSLFVVGGIKTA